MKALFLIFTALASSSAFANKSLFDCDNGGGYLQTSTQVWVDEATGKVMSAVTSYDIENPPAYNASYRGLKVIENEDGSTTVTSRTKNAYRLEVSADKKSATLTSTDIESITLTCQ